MSEILDLAVECVTKAKVAYCKFIKPNDIGSTGGHQSGYHIHKSAWSIFLDAPATKGANLEKFVKIKWQNDFTTESRFIYYGNRTRNEYRLTRFGKGFPFLNDENFGNLLVICKIDDENYEAYVLSKDEEIESFLAEVGINITEVNSIISAKEVKKPTLEDYFSKYIASIKGGFPSSIEISNEAKRIFEISNKTSAIKEADKTILGWLEMEYKLFKAIETHEYSEHLSKGFKDVESLVDFSNTVLNRRKSRAGKSLENHLSTVFSINELRFETQVVTEGKKKPDFIFPGAKEYRDMSFDFHGLTFLGAKTTCKDRWRQILNEAKRIPDKHLFTLQQGISSSQLQEMKDENVTLVIPEMNRSAFPKQFRPDIMSLNTFISFVKEKQVK